MKFEEKLVRHQRELAEDDWLEVLENAVLRHLETGDKTQDLRDLSEIPDDIPTEEEELLEWLSSHWGKRRDLACLLSTCYYKESWDGKPDIMFLMETPGSLTDREDSRHREAKHLLESDSIQEQIRIYRKFSHGWLGKNLRKNFTIPFLHTLAGEGLIEERSDWTDYIPEERDEIEGGESPFFKDFYISDVVSYRIKGGDVTSSLKDEGMEITLQEIAEIKPRILFAFGNKSWSSIRREAENSDFMELEPVSEDVDVESGITSVHGGLYRASFSEKQPWGEEITNESLPDQIYVMPLAHMSRAKLYLRDSYFNLLKDGLQGLDNE